MGRRGRMMPYGMAGDGAWDAVHMEVDGGHEVQVYFKAAFYNGVPRGAPSILFANVSPLIAALSTRSPPRCPGFQDDFDDDDLA